MIDARDPAEYEQAAARVLAETLAGWAERYPDVDVVTRLVAGRPVPALVEESAGATLLVVGSHGHGWFAGMLLGSVSQAAPRQRPGGSRTASPLEAPCARRRHLDRRTSRPGRRTPRSCCSWVISPTRSRNPSTWASSTFAPSRHGWRCATVRLTSTGGWRPTYSWPTSPVRTVRSVTISSSCAACPMTGDCPPWSDSTPPSTTTCGASRTWSRPSMHEASGAR